MIRDDQWERLLSKQVQQVGLYWWAKFEFESVIADLLNHVQSPLRGLQYLLDFDTPFSPIEIGNSADGDCDSWQFELNDTRNGNCRIKLWSASGSSSPNKRIAQRLQELLLAWWKPELRTPSAGLPDLKRDLRAEAIAERTVNDALQEGRSVGIAFCDLDNFGKVNNEHSYAAGNNVIRAFGAVVEPVVSQFGVLLHNGGDEMVVLCRSGGALAALLAAKAAHSALTAHKFEFDDIRVGISGGMAATDVSPDLTSFAALRDAAEVELKKVKASGKGRARFAAVATATPLVVEGDALARLLKCLVVSTSGLDAPFHNHWLNALTAVVGMAVERTGVSADTISTAAKEFLDWQAATDDSTPLYAGRPPSFRPAARSAIPTSSMLATAFSIVHGILRGETGRASTASRMTIAYEPDGRSASVSIDDEKVWASAEPAGPVNASVVPIIQPTTSESSSARCVLIKIGHGDLPVPVEIFSEVVVVDDRPTIGGRLPDFWEVTIARVVTAISANPNLIAVYVEGAERNGAQTVERLRDVEHWHEKAEDLAARVAVPTSVIHQAAESLRTQLHFPADYRALIEDLSAKLDTAPSLRSCESIETASRPMMQRQLEMSHLELRATDGCRVTTAAEAFPVVLEILRTANVESIRDQAGQNIRELVDFRVHLTRPESDMIPDYYRSRQASMDGYVKQAFLADDSLFGMALREGDQLDAVVKHVAKVVRAKADAFATRRAILVVPHHIEPESDLSPLGLVSVRIMPRFEDGRCSLSYSFTWRTVEALVGFPYSLYGSIRFAVELTRMVGATLTELERATLVTGELSYVAHSLHMFMDSFGQAIVRRIVNDATI